MGQAGNTLSAPSGLFYLTHSSCPQEGDSLERMDNGSCRLSPIQAQQNLRTETKKVPSPRSYCLRIRVPHPYIWRGWAQPSETRIK